MAIHHESFEVQGKRVVLRNPEPGDAQSMIDLVNALDTETVFLAREPGEFEMTLEKEQAFLTEQKESENALFLVCEVDGKVMGSCQASCFTRRRFRHKAVVGIALLKAVCGLGIGRKMMNSLISWGKERGLSHLELEVDSKNLPALKLYMSLGFLVGGIKYHARRLADGTYRDDYYMYLPLEA
jgi:ribosomal protein S18 acetylase RimI-like enzyme